jgi:hypothetical protein
MVNMSNINDLFQDHKSILAEGFKDSFDIWSIVGEGLEFL